MPSSHILGKVYVSFISLWLIIIVVPAFEIIPDDFRIFVYNYRLLFISALVLIVSSIQIFISFTSRRLKILEYLAGLLFPLWYLMLFVFYDRIKPEVVAFYFIWSLFYYLVIPAINSHLNLHDVAISVVFTSAGMISAVAILKISGLLHESPAVKGMYFGFQNNNYFAQICQIFFIGAFYLLASGNSGRTNRAVLSACAIFVMSLSYLAEARNVIMFYVVFIVVYFLWRIRSVAIRSYAIIFTIAAGTIVAQYIVDSTKYKNIDDFSSGRISGWSRTIDAFEVQIDPITFLIGPEYLPDSKFSVYDSLGRKKRYNKYHIDNIYLEIFFEAGLVGLLLFFVPLSFVLIRSLRSRSVLQKRIAISLAVAAAFQGLFVSIFPSFNSPVAFILPLFLRMHVKDKLCENAIDKNHCRLSDRLDKKK